MKVRRPRKVQEKSRTCSQLQGGLLGAISIGFVSKSNQLGARRMTSDRQIAANRRNAQRSTGPRTPEGRDRSSRNAQTHGVLSERVTTDEEGDRLYQAMLNDLMVEYEPRSQTEALLVERLANLFWRERRLVRSERQELSEVEANIFEVASGAPTSLPISKQILIGRYQTMLTNQIALTIAQLNRLLSRQSE